MSHLNDDASSFRVYACINRVRPGMEQLSVQMYALRGMRRGERAGVQPWTHLVPIPDGLPL